MTAYTSGIYSCEIGDGIEKWLRRNSQSEDNFDLFHIARFLWKTRQGIRHPVEGWSNTRLGDTLTKWTYQGSSLILDSAKKQREGSSSWEKHWLGRLSCQFRIMFKEAANIFQTKSIRLETSNNMCRNSVTENACRMAQAFRH